MHPIGRPDPFRVMMSLERAMETAKKRNKKAWQALKKQEAIKAEQRAEAAS